MVVAAENRDRGLDHPAVRRRDDRRAVDVGVRVQELRAAEDDIFERLHVAGLPRSPGLDEALADRGEPAIRDGAGESLGRVEQIARPAGDATADRGRDDGAGLHRPRLLGRVHPEGLGVQAASREVSPDGESCREHVRDAIRGQHVGLVLPVPNQVHDCRLVVHDVPLPPSLQLRG